MNFAAPPVVVWAWRGASSFFGPFDLSRPSWFWFVGGELAFSRAFGATNQGGGRNPSIRECSASFRFHTSPWITQAIGLEHSFKVCEVKGALRVIPRGKQRLTVYRAHQVVLASGCQTSVIFGYKNGNISKSVNSFCMGAISSPTRGHELSRKAFVVSVYAL